MNIQGIDHLELYVGDAQQSGYYYSSAFGFEVGGQGGPETGLVGQRSLLMCQGEVRMVLTSGLYAEHPAAEYVQRHGDGVAVVGLRVDDAAQAFGAGYRNRHIGTLADATATSFFPAKPLGVYGDGGAVFTDDDDLAAVMCSLRVHGEGRDKYDCVRVGLNGRFDTVQAAVLIEKLKIFPEEIAARERIAQRYSARLADVATVPRVAEGTTSVWARLGPERAAAFEVAPNPETLRMVLKGIQLPEHAML